MTTRRRPDYKGIEKQLNMKNCKKVASFIRRSLESDLHVSSAEEYYADIMKPTESPLYKFINEVQASKGVHNFERPCNIMEFDNTSSAFRFRKIKSTTELKRAITKYKKKENLIMELREVAVRKTRRKFLKNLVEDMIGGAGFSNDDFGNGQDRVSGFSVKREFTPLLGTPFFKQMYLYDYLLMHSKCFYMKNYSGLAKNIINTTRNFVIGRGFSVTIDKPKAQEAWDKYMDRSQLAEILPDWCDELCYAGEIFLKRVFTPAGIVHKSIDPSTIWEIVTDPENINDVKYYHQQYATQYQIFGDKNTPLSKYIINQIPADQIIHKKVNVTSYEKRGRSDFLSALLYLKYFDDYTQFKLLRVKNEAAFLWDVEIDGDEDDVQAYLQASESITNVPPGSENVHNKALKRTPLSPALSHASDDDVMKWIVGYSAMSVNLPVNYLGFESSGGGTRAGALVATEPVIRKFDERRTKVEQVLHIVFEDVMIDAGIDPDSVEYEFNFPEFINEDRSAKLKDLKFSQDEAWITHERAAGIAAKELNITNYDYEKELADISKERQDLADLFPLPDADVEIQPSPSAKDQPQGGPSGNDPGLTKSAASDDPQDNRAFNRQKVRQQSKTL